MSDLATDEKDEKERRERAEERHGDPDALGPCALCDDPFGHDQLAVYAGFAFNTHGSWMNDPQREDGWYHHECLMQTLVVFNRSRFPEESLERYQDGIYFKRQVGR